MKIRDIVNRDIVNLDNCEQEPIHIPGSIQPHGFLLGLKEDSFIIDFCSANCAGYITQTYPVLLGSSFAEVFGNEALQQLKEYIADGHMLSSRLLRINLEGKDFLCTVHKSGSSYIFEAEPVNTEERTASTVYDQTSQFLSYMHETHTLKELCALVAKGTRELTGYDRVMIYRFDNDYNGEVFAESVREDLEPFLGLHYPHTDIPPQARQLYMQNLLRLIADINYTPVPIYTIDDREDKNLDLSLSILRSTSPIHVQYLQNMGVGATLTISLIYKKRLWGLIACHHYSPKNISPEVRLAAQLQGHFITSQIDVRQSSEEYEEARKTTLALENMNTYSLEDQGALQKIADAPDILKLCNAGGVSIVFNGKVYKHGVTPGDDEIKHLAAWLAGHTGHTSFNTDKIIDHLPEMKDFCERTPGIIYHSLDIDNDNCIIWYRPETITEVHWGGDPSKSIIKDQKGLSPRKSFELWKEIVSCTSKPWLQPEIDASAAYAHSLQRHINLLIVSLEEEKYRKLSELLQQSNSDLENINWISTHDLQEPLRKIQLISSRALIKEQDMSPDLHDSITRMNSSAQRMQTLLVDILKYTKLKHIYDSFETVDLNSLVEEVKTEIDETISGQPAEIIVDTLPSIEGIPFLLRQLFSNLISNSVKYASPDRSPVIKITAAHELVPYHPEDKHKYHLIYVADNGIGFDEKYSESIFNIFTKLHASTEYKGSGVGLALCRKIMQNHNGYIMASGKLGTGAVMSLYFPAGQKEV